MRHLIFILSAILFIGCSTPPKKPNILFIVADDLGYHDLSCMGSTYYETPNIDKIAQNGMTFVNGYATCQVCSPSRASLMSGKLPARHGITDWLGAKTDTAWRDAKRFTKLLPPNYVSHLPHEYTTLPEALKEQNYATFFAGKWHLGEKGSYPEDHGFDINKGGYERGGPYSGGFFSPFNNPKMEDFPEEKGISLSMKLARETAQFIENNQDSAFFAMLSFYAVHSPIQTTEERWRKYRSKAEAQGIAANGFEMEQRLPIRQHQDNPVYAGLIEQMDDAVGYVLETLEKLGLDENTIIVFTSDHGGVASGDNYSTSNAPLRGGKGYQWEGGLKVPYFISVPWMKHGGKKTEIPATGTDFYPTFLELIGADLKPQEHQDGVSLLSALEGKKIEERSLYWHYPHYGNQGGDPSSIITEGEWKLIHYWEDGNNELYNIVSDIGEEKNVSEQFPEIAERMNDKLINWLEKVGAKYPKQDSLFSMDSLKIKQEWYKTELMPRLERQRKEMLSQNWKPNTEWWGSKVKKD